MTENRIFEKTFHYYTKLTTSDSRKYKKNEFYEDEPITVAFSQVSSLEISIFS